MAELRATSLIRDIPDFPQPGIVFKDITPLLADPLAMREVVDALVHIGRSVRAETVAGIESRGFVFGAPMALELGVPFVPIRKPGKLPYKTIQEEYELEYGKAAIEIHTDAIRPGCRVLVVDDLLATGGTAAAAARLVKRVGGVVCGFSFVIELAFLKGRELLKGMDVVALIRYE